MNDARIGRRGLLGVAGLLIASPAWAAQPKPLAKPRVAIQTDHGVIVVELESGKAPVTCANFLRYVDARKYDGGSFYRASKTKGVKGAGSIQGGPPDRVRRFAPIAHESTRLTGIKHRAGTISMARNAPGSATCDFFICASPQPYLDAHPGAAGDNQGFAAFGGVVQGLDVVKKILALKADGPAPYPAMKGQMLNPPVKIIGMKRA
ncbi:peptidylprolyl isomerase [Caulobacter sp. Root487D2Y]|uniref:peptidylprolyl isomerase n=1 Tax=Caulobacter sp. Root487D2Y TaxID=1736547 RepID=UPI0007006C68|nr:peptidylprolyl isomerase [Caulobacter sp. Root487D2Y]KQY35239.1 peptidylprolyl isomerase [Caulobacter sp. Root487D2Y]